MRAQSGGSLYRRGGIWWVKYYRDGRPIRQSTGETLEKPARAFLAKRMGAIAEGMPENPRADRIRVGDRWTIS